jgi:hypothetical protein
LRRGRPHEPAKDVEIEALPLVRGAAGGRRLRYRPSLPLRPLTASALSRASLYRPDRPHADSRQPPILRRVRARIWACRAKQRTGDGATYSINEWPMRKGMWSFGQLRILPHRYVRSSGCSYRSTQSITGGRQVRRHHFRGRIDRLFLHRPSGRVPHRPPIKSVRSPITATAMVSAPPRSASVHYAPFVRPSSP